VDDFRDPVSGEIAEDSIGIQVNGFDSADQRSGFCAEGWGYYIIIRWTRWWQQEVLLLF